MAKHAKKYKAALAKVDLEKEYSVRDAVALARRERPWLVVLDVRLPDISGYEVCRQLRDEFGNELGIVFVSADRTEPMDHAAGLLVGADDLRRSLRVLVDSRASQPYPYQKLSRALTATGLVARDAAGYARVPSRVVDVL